MSADIATLGIAVDSRPVVEGTKALDALGESAARVDQKVRASNAGMSDTAKIMQAQAEQAKAAAQANAVLGSSTDRLTIGQQRFMDALRDQAATVGMSRTQLLEYRAAELGLTEQTKELIAQIENATKAQAGHTVGMGSSMAKMEAFRVIHDAMIGSYNRMGSSLFVLGNATGATTALLNPATIGFVALGAAVVGMAVAMKQGHDEMVAMDNALAMTSGFAGMTRADMDRLAVSMTNTRQVTVGTANEIVMALVSSGKISGDAIDRIAKMTANYASATGQDIDQIAPKLIALFEDPAKGAETLNSSMHFLTVTQIEHIAALQRTGEVQRAQDELAQAAAGHIPDQVKKRGTLVQILVEERDAWSKLWQAMKDHGKDDGNPIFEAQKVRDEISELITKGYSRQSPEVKYWDDILDKMEPAIKRQKELTQAEKDAAAANQLQAQSWDAVKASSTAYHIQELQDRKKLIEAYKPEAGPDFAAQETARRDAIRKTQDEIDAANRAIGAEARQLTQQQITAQDQLALAKLKGAADDINNQLKLGIFSKEQFDIEMSRNALEVNEEKQSYELRMAHVAGLTQVERQAHADKLNLLKIEHDQIEANGAAQIDIDDKKIMDDYMAALGKAGQSAIDSLNQQIVKERERGLEIGKTKEQVDALRAAQQQQFAGELQGQVEATEAMLAGLDANNHALDDARAIYAAWLATTKTKIEEINTLSQISASNAILDADAKAAADAAQAWKHAANTIENDLTNAILDGGGKGWKKLIRDMEMAFAKMVLQPILEPISGGLASMAAPFMSSSGIGSVAGLSGGVTGLAGLANTASGLYGAITGGLSLSGGLGTGFMGSIAGGLNGAGIGSGLTSELGLNIGSSIASVVGPGVSSAIASGIGAIATALPWVAGAVAAVSIGKLAFGMGPKQTTSQGMSGTISADSLTGSNYSDWKEKGGWFRSDKHGTDTTAFSAQTIAQFTQGMQMLEASATGFASSLGVSADWIKTYSKDFNITLTGDATKDQQAVADFFAGVGDELANKLVPNLAEFSKTGETASATLQRLAGDFQATDQAMQLIGKTAADAFGSSGMDSAKVREQLVNAFGGTSNMTSLTQSYATNYLTNAEKLVPVQKALDAAMASLGLSCVKTEAQFKAVVSSLDLTTQAGANEFASLMALNGAFVQVYASGKTADQVLSEHQALQDKLDALTMSSIQLHDKERATIDASNLALYDRVSALQAEKDAAQSVLGDVDNAFTVLQNAMKPTTDALNTRIAAEKSLSDAIKSTLSGMKAASTDLTERMAAQAQIKAALAIAKAGGPLPTADSLKDALSVVSQDASSKFATQADYLKDLYSTKNDLSQLGDLADSSLSVDQKQLDSLNAMLAADQQQIDLLKGIATSLTVSQAQAGFQGAVGSAQANPVVAANSGISGLYQSLLGRAPDAAGLAYWQQVAAGGASMDSIRAGFMGGSEYKSLHPFAVGTNEVPDTMAALIHKGERIIPAADNRALMARLASPSSNNDALTNAVDRLNKTVERQNDIIDKQGKTIELVRRESKRQADFIERLTNGGQYMPTKAVA
jgi:phage-related minor tail protein